MKYISINVHQANKLLANGWELLDFKMVSENNLTEERYLLELPNPVKCECGGGIRCEKCFETGFVKSNNYE